jgi:hypothetical protein
MHQLRRVQLASLQFALGILLVTALSMQLSAQQGQNAVVQSNGGSIVTSPSYAIVDATQFQNQGSDLCATINNIFNVYYPNVGAANGIVVDARGFSGSALQCASGTNPWSKLITQEINNGNDAFTNIVLLPAGQISIVSHWILPNYTHLIGQGPNSTVIVLASGFGSPDMIEMGSELTPMPCYTSSNDCSGIVIEHLGIIGNLNEEGIVNCCAQELSRVNDVSISTVTTGLALSDRFAENSGPYTNLTISGVNTCLAIGPALNTGLTGPMVNSRGVRGLQCSVNSTNTPAITIDGPNNSLEDISISTSATGVDGILIGSKGPAEGNTLLNIRGSGLKNVIHISNANNNGNGSGVSGPQNCPYTYSAQPPHTGTVYYVCDLTIFGVARSSGTSSVQDDLTGTTITDSTLAMYTLGEIVGNNNTPFGYSRFTTAASGNTNATPWLVGAIAPSGNCAVGTLYSCTSSSCPFSLYQCLGGSTWTKIQ